MITNSDCNGAQPVAASGNLLQFEWTNSDVNRRAREQPATQVLSPDRTGYNPPNLPRTHAQEENKTTVSALEATMRISAASFEDTNDLSPKP